MSDETSRPRRAWQPEDDLQESLLPENAVEEADASPRRGAAAPDDPADDISAGLGDEPAPVDDAAGPEGPEADDLPVEDPAPEPRNPFARPGSEEAATALTDEPAPMIPAPIFPRSAGEYADSPSPAPRRSALSSNTPVEVEPAEPAVEAQPVTWARAHRGSLVKWALIGIVGALVVGLIAFFVARGRDTAEPVEPPPTSVSESPSPSPTPEPEPAEEADLVTNEDLVPIAPASEWSTISTTLTAPEHTMRALCLSTAQQTHNPTHSFQRTLGTTGTDKLAALHRIDVYANETAAQGVLDARIQSLSNCNEVPARIVRASQVNGLAEETFQVTILQEEATAKYHTVLMTRDGAALQLIDVARDAEAVDPLALATAVTRAQSRIAEVQGTAGPTTPEAVATVVPPAEPVGWLTPVDLPRLNPGIGRWTMTSPQPIDTRGMGCENIELATEAGPTERAEIAYSLTQDTSVPERFGIDELLFTFPSPAEAAAFVTKLGANMHSCKDRVNTAEVEELPGVAPRDAEGNVLSARIFKASQAISDNERVHYQTVVAVAGNKVAYTLVSVTPEVQFTPEQLTELANRVTVRASQQPPA